ncbi:MAG TPA: ATP-dependent helicase C-terminal domain-containing protein, partial [Bryobacteraceae bacterium]
AAALLGAGARLAGGQGSAGPSDLFAMIESEWDPQARLAYNELRRLVPRSNVSPPAAGALLLAALAAFGDRVARRRRGDELALAGGGSALLARESVVRDAGFLVAIDVEERSERGLPLVRLASAIEPEWLLELFPERIHERRTLEWNRAAERVEAASSLVFDQLVIEESRGAPRAEDQPWRLLAERALEAGAARFADPAEIEAYLDRVAFAARYSSLPALADDDVRQALASLAEGLRSFAELREAARDGGLLRAIERRLPSRSALLLDELAPARLRLPGGRYVRVEYPRGETPRVAAKLQEFFGMRDTPRVARGQAPVVVHLLAPNQRPVQATTDLAGFWQRLYPGLRRELGRRYPRHRWPEDPLQAAPGERDKSRLR